MTALKSATKIPENGGVPIVLTASMIEMSTLILTHLSFFPVQQRRGNDR
jgi:hypothetical protein